MSPARHAVYYRMTARNRVWLAKRHLPAALVRRQRTYRANPFSVLIPGCQPIGA